MAGCHGGNLVAVVGAAAWRSRSSEVEVGGGGLSSSHGAGDSDGRRMVVGGRCRRVGLPEFAISVILALIPGRHHPTKFEIFAILTTKSNGFIKKTTEHWASLN